ncbi:MAG: hypothetical protein ASARMPRED_004142 [Alectoria sarmentosa]|nr:MAG: hypothetical protein ASARMPRED_004142 [Alectoria sarmentosa]
MARFSDLPNELVREVAGHVMPDDIESFSLISSGVYAQALPLLKEHRELKSRYSAFGNLEKTGFDGRRLGKSDFRGPQVMLNCYTGDSLSNLLTDVLTDHRVVPYIKELRLDYCCLAWESEDPDPSNERHEHIPYTEEQFALFKQALSRYLLPAKLEAWTTQLELGHEGPIITLLIALLPNINSIKFEGGEDLSYHVREAIECIKTDSKPGMPILARLERVNLVCNKPLPFPGGDPCAVEFLAFLATIPSLKSLYADQITLWDGPYDFSCLSPHSSNIIDLGLKSCDLSHRDVEDLLQGLKALQSFHFIFDVHFEMGPWDAAEMCKVLSKHAQGSLEVLDIRSDLEAAGPIENLRDFEVLKELALSLSLFRAGKDSPSRTLAAQLPESIQEFGLHDIEVKDISLLEDSICEVMHCKSDRLPMLEKVLCASWDLEGLSQVTDKLRESCENVGFELCFVKEE